jgi:N-acetylglutamate synthase-like GNAT family acetyltransferase
MEGPRPPFENEYPKVVNFVTTALRPHSTWSISEEYPTAFNLSNLNNIRVVFDENEVVSHAIMKPLIVKTPLLDLKVGVIGSVVTATSHRQQGLSRQILEDCLQNASLQNCDLALLWTDIPDFYRKLGFEFVGTELQFLIDRQLCVTQATALRFVTGPQVSPDAVYNLYRKHTVHTHRSIEDFRRLLNIPNSKIYTAWSSDNQLMAYAVEGKGADLQNHIHEWGGNIPELFALLNFIRKTSGTAPRLLVPAHSKNLIRHLTDGGVPVTENYLGMMKLLRPDLFSQKVKKAARDLGLRDLVFDWNGSQFTIGDSTNLVTTVNPVDILRLAFGPVSSQQPSGFNKLFPLSFWLWGWDSI